MGVDRALTAGQVVERAHGMCDRSCHDGLTLGGAFEPPVAELGVRTGDLERDGNQGAAHPRVVTQPDALRMGAFVLAECAEDLDERPTVD